MEFSIERLLYVNLPKRMKDGVRNVETTEKVYSFYLLLSF